jgi:hypothetical protein
VQTTHRLNVLLSNEDLTHAVDLEVIKQRSSIFSAESTESRKGFRNDLLERDQYCVFTGVDPLEAAGVHIIPFARGSEVCSIIGLV